jgi:hypothetical protein
MNRRSNAVPLKEHIEVRIDALEKATEVAAKEMNRRLEGMNEFRAQLDKQTRTFIDKDHFESRWDSLCNRVVSLENFKERQVGKANQKDVTITLIVALSSLALGIGSIIVVLLK